MSSATKREFANSTPEETLQDICILDNEPPALEMLQETLELMGFSSFETSDPQEALRQIGNGKCRVVLCHIEMLPMDGLTFLKQVLQRDPGVYVVLMTSSYSIESAIEAIKRGAYDYMPKPIDPSRLRKTFGDLAELFQQRRRIRELDQQLLNNFEFHGIVGRSPSMLEVFDLARKIARHYTNVLITGPTGTGKELVAHAIHELSPVPDQRFAVCNCSAMVDTLLESQLFGHLRGAFTGVTENRPGLFDYADGGTVFLDEVGETSLVMQAKLLRVIQNREIQRVGSPEVRRVNVRLIASTNRDLRAEVLAGHFREDLFYRLNTIQIVVPSLVERLEDIPLLVAYFVKKYNEAYQKQIQGLTRRAQTVLLQHAWPGNVRELENVISFASLVAANDFIDVDDLPDPLRKPFCRGGAGEPWRPVPLEEMRKEHIERVLQMCSGNRVRAARMLGIGRTSLYRHLKRESGSRPPTGIHAA
jgi:two-component system, NtrC family, response regulator HydG